MGGDGTVPGEVLLAGEVPGVTVMVTVGVGLTCGAGGSTENRGLCRGGSITMPTIPSAAKSTYGVTSARAVSEPARLTTS